MFIREQSQQSNKVEILKADATKLQQMIKDKHLTVLEATRVYIEQIERTKQSINHIVENRYKSAMEEARKADDELAEGRGKGKLFGIPISMKESFDVKGMQTTGGLVRRRGKFSKEDAHIVRKLREEGAIILGKSNTPELCFCQETDNKLYGKTNNPRDLTRTAGGSSGGEAAVIASGAVAAGIGSDIGGSIRIPSHFNGVIGFKSGRGQVSSKGSYPREIEPLQKRMLGIGPITKSVRDAKLIYSIIANEQMIARDLGNMTINILPETEFPLSIATSALLQKVYDNLREKLLVERIKPPYFNESSILWQEIMSINGGKTIRSEAFENKSASPMGQYLKEIVSGKSANHRYLLWALIGASLFKPSKLRIKEIKKRIEAGDKILDDYLANRIMIFPVYHTSAPKHGTVYKEIFSIRKTFKDYMPYLAYANVWGLPSLTIPLAKDKEEMPIALQLMSKNGNEDALFQLGSILERGFLGYERADV